jgi:rhamnose utilization protein RhaD (predicted bifunctional aldolase and dehydrogenase)
MDRLQLAGIWHKAYPEDINERETAVLGDMMAARKPGEEQKRPSVETLLHDMLPFAYVVHTHPSLVNGLTCSLNGEQAARELFASQAVWIPVINPGYILALAVKKALDAYTASRGKPPAIIFLQNHGVFVGADSAEAIKAVYAHIMHTLGERITKKPDFSSGSPVYGPSDEAARLLGTVAEESDAAGAPYTLVFERNNAIAGLSADRASFAPVSGALTPDHIVYAGSDPLFIETGPGGLIQEEPLRRAWKAHREKTGRLPKIIVLQGVGAFGMGRTEKSARLALELFTDAIKVAFYAQAFGGPCFMTPDKVDFINNWEAERYRSKISG